MTQYPDFASLSPEDADFLKKLKEFVRSQGEAYLSDPNITSVGIGFKMKDGKRTPDLSVQFTVRTKAENDDELEKLGSRPIPKSVTVAGRQVATDVIQRQYEPGWKLVAEGEAVKEDRKKRRPVIVPGISVGHPKTTAGTVGAIVFDAHTGTPCMLSNWHVLQTDEGKPGDPVLQPGPYDDNRTAQNRAGTLLRSHLGRAGDCAIAGIEERGSDATVLDLRVPIAQLARPELGDRVVKSGRTTGVTYGIVRRIETTAKIHYGAAGEHLIGGFEIGPDEEHPAPENEISKGGDSGSAWLVAQDDGAPTDIMVGLHFGGEGAGNPDEHALACYAHAVFEKLEISLAPPAADAALTLAPEAAATGFDVNFLGVETPFPTLSQPIRGDAVKLDGSHLIPYTHFTLCLSESRRLARFVAWNIDGARMRKVPRTTFRYDRRLSDQLQTGPEVYRHPSIDLGHIAMRADLCWGGKVEAERANYDSFFYTNVAPQHEAFNQSSKGGLWGKLEGLIFDEAKVKDLRVSVMGGPILDDHDRAMAGVQVPRSFWKVVGYVDDVDGEFKARAYVLTQKDLLHDIEALELDGFRMFQVAVDELETLTGLRLTALKRADTFEPEAVPEAEELVPRRAVREIRSAAEVVR